MITEADFNRHQEGYTTIRAAVIVLAESYILKYGVRSGPNLLEEITGIEIEGDTIEINTETWYQGSGTDTDSYSLPVMYLWANWQVLEDSRRAAAKEARLEQEAKAKQVRLDMEKAKRKAKYEKLKAEFEEGE